MNLVAAVLPTLRSRLMAGGIALVSLFMVVAGAADSLVIGAVLGLVYAVVAMGLVLIYKGSRVVNFAHAQMATVGAFAAWGLLTVPDADVPGRWHATAFPWLLAAILGVATGALLGMLVESTVIRRLFKAPRLIVLVATLALAQVLTVVTYLIWLRGDAEVAAVRPFPDPLEISFRVGNFRVLGAHILAAIVVPIVGLGLAAFFKFSRTGIAVRAASDNPDAARLLGVSVRRVSLVTWGLGAALAAMAGILIAPIQGGLTMELLGWGLFIRALTAAVIGGMTSLPGAVGGGLAVGIGEAAVTRFVATPGVTEMVLFAAILAVLLTHAGREREEGQLAFAPAIRKVPAWIKDHWSVGVPRFAIGYWLLVVVVLIPLALSPSANFALSLMLVYAMLGVSLNLLMGTAGQISLGHFALLGVGAFTGAKLVTDLGMPYVLAFAFAGLVGGLIALLVGLPALRIRGLYLAIATLAFAVAAEAYLFRLEFLGARFGISFDRPQIGPFDLDSATGREFSYFCVAALAAMIWLARNLERRRAGRALLSVRENEKSAAVLGVSVRGYKLLGFTFSGVLAAWAGVIYGMLNPPVQFGAFPPVRSLEIVAMVIIGGLGSVPGAVLGAMYVVGIPRMFPDADLAPLLATGFGLLLVLMIRPGGLWSLVTGLRDFFVWGLTVEDRAFKGPLSRLVPPDVPERARIESMFEEAADEVEDFVSGDGHKSAMELRQTGETGAEREPAARE